MRTSLLATLESRHRSSEYRERLDVPHVVDEEAARECELSPADEEAQEEKDEREEERRREEAGSARRSPDLEELDRTHHWGSWKA